MKRNEEEYFDEVSRWRRQCNDRRTKIEEKNGARRKEKFIKGGSRKRRRNDYVKRINRGAK